MDNFHEMSISHARQKTNWEVWKFKKWRRNVGEPYNTKKCKILREIYSSFPFFRVCRVNHFLRAKSAEIRVNSAHLVEKNIGSLRKYALRFKSRTQLRFQRAKAVISFFSFSFSRRELCNQTSRVDFSRLHPTDSVALSTYTVWERWSMRLQKSLRLLAKSDAS